MLYCSLTSREYPPDGWRDANGKPVPFPHPEGMSGSALWKTSRKERGSGWTVQDARIIGVVTKWDQNANSLIATRIEYVNEFLLFALRQEFAFFHWHDRGRPPGDDWNDWFAAEASVKSIA